MAGETMNTHIYINIHASFEYLNGKPNTQTGSSFPFGYCLDFRLFSRFSKLIPKREKPGKSQGIESSDLLKNRAIVKRKIPENRMKYKVFMQQKDASFVSKLAS